MAQSPVFRTMIETPMMESQNQEMVIEDMSLAGVKMLMKFLYAGTIDDNWKQIPEEIVNASEKYDLPILKEFLDHNLHFTLSTQNALQLLYISKTYKLSHAKENICEFIKGNMDVVLHKL